MEIHEIVFADCFFFEQLPAKSRALHKKEFPTAVLRKVHIFIKVIKDYGLGGICLFIAKLFTKSGQLTWNKV